MQIAMHEKPRGKNSMGSRDSPLPVGTQIVILTIGTNDIRQGVRASETMTNINTIVERLRAKGAEVVVIRWVLPYGQYVDEGGTIPVVDRLSDRIVIPSLLRGIPPELITMGLHHGSRECDRGDTDTAGN